MKTKIKYILIITVILIILYYSLKHIIKISSLQDSNINTVPDALNDIKSLYGFDIAQNVEKIYRLETAHFESEQYKKTGSAGMLSFNNSFPYGWTTQSPYWATHNKYKPLGVGYSFTNSEGQNFEYLKFDNFGGFYTLANFLQLHNNNAGRWNSTNEAQQETYNTAISLITNKYIV